MGYVRQLNITDGVLHSVETLSLPIENGNLFQAISGARFRWVGDDHIAGGTVEWRP